MMTKDDRQWHKSRFDYHSGWRFREWGPMDKALTHPLRLIFRAGAMSHATGLAWLKWRLYIGAHYQRVEEIPRTDVHWLLDLAQSRFSMEWIEDLRERYEKNLQKVA